jgi:hypothetical protein
MIVAQASKNSFLDLICEADAVNWQKIQPNAADFLFKPTVSTEFRG